MSKQKSYPLIILGAGASNDFIEKRKHDPIGYRDPDLDKFQPPLTNDIFDISRFETDFLEEHEETSFLASDFNYKYKQNKSSLEQYLTKIAERKTSDTSSTKKQLVDLHYYIADLFYRISENYYKPVNNYKALIQRLHLAYDDKPEVCFINYNYDLLLEKNFINTDDVNSYIKNDLKIIKIHGACNWVKRVKLKTWEPGVHAFKYYSEDPSLMENAKNSLITTHNNHSEKVFWNYLHRKTGECFLPALAIPTIGKIDYICPDDHIKELDSSLKKVDRILIIGWRAEDPFLLNKLKEVISSDNRKIICLVVSQNLKSAENIIQTLNKFKITKLIYKASPAEGFSNFLTETNDLEKLLNI